MTDVCTVCGLPKDLCVCGTISMEQQVIIIRKEMRKWGKAATVIEGIDPKSIELSQLATRLKAKCACGGTAKNGQIILQGDHREKVKKLLAEEGFPTSNVEVH